MTHRRRYRPPFESMESRLCPSATTPDVSPPPAETALPDYPAPGENSEAAPEEDPVVNPDPGYLDPVDPVEPMPDDIPSIGFGDVDRVAPVDPPADSPSFEDLLPDSTPDEPEPPDMVGGVPPPGPAPIPPVGPSGPG